MLRAPYYDCYNCSHLLEVMVCSHFYKLGQLVCKPQTALWTCFIVILVGKRAI